MSIILEDKNKLLLDLLNDTYSSLSMIVPLNQEARKPQIIEQALQFQFGVLIGITADIKGKMILSGESNVFGFIGESMFGMPLEGEMLLSFSGELGNMIAGGLSTRLVERGINTDITAPTILQGNTILSGYQKAAQTSVVFENKKEVKINLLLD